MADIKWSAFPTTAAGAASGDVLVGLHSAANYQFTLSPSAVALAVMQRDANNNVSANNFLEGYATTATAAGTTTLLVGSAYFQYFTGSTTQTVVMPVTSTLALGQSWMIVNNSSGNVTVNSSGGSAIQVMAANTSLLITCILTSGTTAASWNASYISDAGGSVGSGTANQLAYYAAAGNALSGVGPGSSGQLFQSNGSGSAPAYTTATYPTTTTVSQLLYSSSSNVVAGLAVTNRAVLSSNATGIPSWIALTDGQLVIGSTAGAPAAATISAGAGVSVTNASNSITIASTGVGSLVWNDVSGTSQAAVVNNGYVISNASQTTVTIPATAALGSVFGVVGKGAAGWILQMNTGQVVHYGSSASSSAGSLTSTNQWDSVQIVCVTANTTFAVIASQGILTVA